ncbi:hypothetical protein D3C83_33040 [compost metagenome]
MQRLDEDHAVQPVHERDGEAEPVVQHQVDRAAPAEDELHRDRAHERRHDERQHTQRLDNGRAAEFEAHGEIGERHGDKRGQEHAPEADVEAVPERFLHERDLEERDEMRKREAAFAVGEGHV